MNPTELWRPFTNFTNSQPAGGPCTKLAKLRASLAARLPEETSSSKRISSAPWRRPSRRWRWTSATEGEREKEREKGERETTRRSSARRSSRRLGEAPSACTYSTSTFVSAQGGVTHAPLSPAPTPQPPPPARPPLPIPPRRREPRTRPPPHSRRCVARRSVRAVANPRETRQERRVVIHPNRRANPQDSAHDPAMSPAVAVENASNPITFTACAPGATRARRGNNTR